MCFLCVLLDKDLPAVLYSVQRDLNDIHSCGIRDEADNCPWGGWSNGVQLLAGDTVERDGTPVCGLEPVDLHHKSPSLDDKCLQFQTESGTDAELREPAVDVVVFGHLHVLVIYLKEKTAQPGAVVYAELRTQKEAAGARIAQL